MFDIAFRPDGRMFASSSFDGTVRLWDVGTSAELAVLEGPSGFGVGVASSPDGRLLVSAGGDGTLRIWGVE